MLRRLHMRMHRVITLQRLPSLPCCRQSPTRNGRFENLICLPKRFGRRHGTWRPPTPQFVAALSASINVQRLEIPRTVVEDWLSTVVLRLSLAVR